MNIAILIILGYKTTLETWYGLKKNWNSIKKYD